MEGETPVYFFLVVLYDLYGMSRVAWECSVKYGGVSHRKLNMDERPIA